MKSVTQTTVVTASAQGGGRGGGGEDPETELLLMGRMKGKFSPTAAQSSQREAATGKTCINPGQIGDCMNDAKNLICYSPDLLLGELIAFLLLIRSTPCILGGNRGAILNK